MKYVFLFALSLSFLEAQVPDWVDQRKRELLYPDEKYLLGFIMEEFEKGSKGQPWRERLLKLAKMQLVESFHVSIHSQSLLQVQNSNQGTKEGFYYQGRSLSVMDLVGVQQQTYFDDKANVAYALAYTNKDGLVKYYKDQFVIQELELQGKVLNAENLHLKGDSLSALLSLLEARTSLIQLSRVSSILQCLSDLEKGEAVLHWDQIIEQGLDNLGQRKTSNIQELAKLLAYQIKSQLGEDKKYYQVNSLTYQSTGLGSIFSKQFEDCSSINWRLRSQI